MADWEISQGQPGDEDSFALIQTESWKAAFRDILTPEVLENATQLPKAVSMYRRLLEQHIGHGYLLRVDGQPHCIAWWDKSRDGADFGAELICIHSLPGNWRKGYGSRMMETVLGDMKAAGFTRATLWVFQENRRARQFYEAHGFSPNGMSKGGFDATEICYEKAL